MKIICICVRRRGLRQYCLQCSLICFRCDGVRRQTPPPLKLRAIKNRGKFLADRILSYFSTSSTSASGLILLIISRKSVQFNATFFLDLLQHQPLGFISFVMALLRIVLCACVDFFEQTRYDAGYRMTSANAGVL